MHLQGRDTLVKTILSPSEQASSLNLRKEFAPNFLREQTSFKKVIGVQQSKQEVTKVVSLVKMALKSPDVSNHLKL